MSYNTFHISYTGSEWGMTTSQYKQLDFLLSRFDQIYAGNIASHHGSCIGGDFEFHTLTYPYREAWDRYIHPPINDKKRADCTGGIEYPPLNYLDRDLVIAIKCHVLIAAPKSYKEELRSGVWYTVRQARLLKKPVIILWPAGRLK